VKSTPFQTKVETITGLGADLHLRTLVDVQQYDDPSGDAERAGISPESWSMFGVVWPSARVLAHAMLTQDLSGQRILEVGGGLSLASLVLHRRQAQVTASDGHPSAGDFLEHNLVLNGLSPMPWRQLNWARPDDSLGRFELIIGSDVLYDHGQAESLSRFMATHGSPGGRVVLVDPNRSHRARFSHLMEEAGFTLSSAPIDAAPGLTTPYRGRLLTYSRR